MEDGACCDRVSAGRSRRPPEPPPPGAAWVKPRRACPPAPRLPLGGTGGCPPDGPRAGPAAQTSRGWGPAGWAHRGGAPGAGPAAAALSGRPAARGPAGSGRLLCFPSLRHGHAGRDSVQGQCASWLLRSGSRSEGSQESGGARLGGHLGLARAVLSSRSSRLIPPSAGVLRAPPATDRERSDKGFCC